MEDIELQPARHHRNHGKAEQLSSARLKVILTLRGYFSKYYRELEFQLYFEHRWAFDPVEQNLLNVSQLLPSILTGIIQPH